MINENKGIVECLLQKGQKLYGGIRSAIREADSANRINWTDTGLERVATVGGVELRHGVDNDGSIRFTIPLQGFLRVRELGVYPNGLFYDRERYPSSRKMIRNDSVFWANEVSSDQPYAYVGGSDYPVSIEGNPEKSLPYFEELKAFLVTPKAYTMQPLFN